MNSIVIYAEAVKSGTVPDVGISKKSEIIFLICVSVFRFFDSGRVLLKRLCRRCDGYFNDHPFQCLESVASLEHVSTWHLFSNRASSELILSPQRFYVVEYPF